MKWCLGYTYVILRVQRSALQINHIFDENELKYYGTSILYL